MKQLFCAATATEKKKNPFPLPPTTGASPHLKNIKFNTTKLPLKASKYESVPALCPCHTAQNVPDTDGVGQCELDSAGLKQENKQA